MEKDMYSKIEQYMLECMNDGAHDSQHIYRVLYSALDIASHYNVDTDVLVAASLLHDIGRNAQFQNQELDHAIIGADMAYEYLLGIGWNESRALHVRDCISSHRYRSNNVPESWEAKILFDADKLDATGTMGIARTIAYIGIVSNPLYCVDENGDILIGDINEEPSFFTEYNWKLKNIYEKFFTDRAREIASRRQKASIDFFDSMCDEVIPTHKTGMQILNSILR